MIHGLPNEVDIKKQGSIQKNYPTLYKLHTACVPDERKSSSSSSLLLLLSSNNNGSSDGNSSSNNQMINEQSPIYRLFNEHLGALTITTSNHHGTNNSNNNKKQYTPNELIDTLSSSTNSVQRYLDVVRQHKRNMLDQEEERLKQQQQGQGQTPLEQQQQQQQQRIPLITELSKLYISSMKQSSFLRQNLINIESWCHKHYTKHEFEDVFPLNERRSDIENVINILEEYRIKRMQQQLLLMKRKEGGQQEEDSSSSQQGQMILQQHQQHQQQQQRLITKRINPNPKSLPSHQHTNYTHGGPNSTPIISIRIRVKVSGWRDKSGTRLIGRLWCPIHWKVALKKAEEKLLPVPPRRRGSQQSASAVVVVGGGASSIMISPPDLSSFDNDTLRVVANELCRYDILPGVQDKKHGKNDAGGGGTTMDDDGNKDALIAEADGSSSRKRSFTKSSSNSSGASTAEVAKKSRKRRSTKEGSSGATSATTATTTASAATSKSSVPTQRPPKKVEIVIPHIPRSRNDAHHPHVPPSAAQQSGGRSSSVSTTVLPDEKKRLVHTLYNKILHPSLTPSQRRTLLANEISSTRKRLENATTKLNNKNSTTIAITNDEEIEQQIQKLQSIYEEDVDIVPTCCNTIGLWNYMKHTNYFDALEKGEDVRVGLEKICHHHPVGVEESDERLDDDDYNKIGDVVDDDVSSEWGRLSTIKSVTSTNVADDQQKDEEKTTEPSPLFDRLQSLLVEVDEGSDSDCNDDDDDHLIANLPSFSPEEFIHGPSDGTNKSSQLNQHDDDAKVDVSALTLDQRTYIQLRAAGLLGKTMPDDIRLPTTPSSSSSKPTVTIIEADEDNSPLISNVLQKMKMDLSTLNVQTNAQAAELQRRALSDVASSASLSAASKFQKQSKDDETTILAKYKQLERMQKEQMNQVRTSVRVKTSSNKFDDEWLPW